MKNLKFKLSIVSCLSLAVFAGMASGADRNTPRTDVGTSVVTAAEPISAGWIVVGSGGYGYKIDSATTNPVVLGISQNSAVSNGVLNVRGSGVYGLKNLGTVTAAHIGGSAYAATNDNGYTVAPSGTATVGKIVNVDSDYVWVRLGL